MMQITITNTHDTMSNDVDNQRPEPLAPSIYTWGRGKMPPKVEGGILQVCLNLNQSGVGFHRVNLLKYEFSFSTLQNRKTILRVCVIILWNPWNILLTMNKPIVMNCHLMILSILKRSNF